MKCICQWGKRLIPLLFFLTLTLAACGKAAPSVPAQVVGLPLGDLFAPVPGSKFLMGSLEGEPLSRPDEYPRHEVILSTFFIMKREVTNLEYQKCVEAGVCSEPMVKETGPTSLYPDPQYGAWPVVGVDWFQAVDYCQFINARLPTEAEWEKAARGREAFRYPWGNDEPTCDLLNMTGCLEELDTEHVVAYEEGVSIYKLADMAGNVREWTADWFSPDYYPTADLYSPAGPEEGDLKITRGGSWDDGMEDVRTAARIPMDPKEKSELVGFRCVPVIQTTAPFCNATYRNFCDPGQFDDGDEPCDPEQQNDCGDYSLAGFGCPLNGQVSINIFVPVATPESYNVTVGDDAFTCGPGGSGFITCTGPEQSMGTEVTITVCGPPSVNIDNVETEMPTVSLPDDILLAVYNTPLLAYPALQSAANVTGYCPYGYTFSEEAGACVVEEDRQPCPEGWHPEPKFDEELKQDVLTCVLDDPLACPFGTTYSEERKGCVPDIITGVELQCPEGYELTEDEMCEPPFLWLWPCSFGNWFDSELGCCVPLESQCEDMTYFEMLIGGCLPQNPGGCPQCTVYDPYLGCVGIPECTPGEQEDSNGLIQTVPLDCYGDDVTPTGECEPPEGGECGEDYVYAPDPQTGEYSCVPFYGPGSGCPEGYALDPRTFCCVPLTDPCPEIEVKSITLTRFGLIHGGDTPDGEIPEGFNPFGGDCEELEDGEGDGDGVEIPECPEGCLPGTSDYWNCYCPAGGSASCDDGTDCWIWDESIGLCSLSDTCISKPEEGSPTNPCGSDDLVWIPELELCFPIGDDCCAPGYDWSAYHETCMPIVQNFAQTPGGVDCGPGYEDVNGLCLLIGRRNPEQCCWSITVNVPRCVGGCEVGYTMVNGQCVKPEPEKPETPSNPCAGIVCSSYDGKNCPVNCGCTQIFGQQGELIGCR